MGSLPNLHELEQIERKLEKRRERELLRERARESYHERERLSFFAQQRQQTSYNAYLMAGLGMGGTLATTATQAATGGSATTASGVAAAATTTLSSIAIGGAALLSLGTPGLLKNRQLHHHQQLQLQHHLHQHQHQHPHQHQHQHLQQQQQQQQHHQHHRHSLTNRNRVLRTRSSGATHIWDEQMMEHLAAYSPISTRSHRITPVSSYQVQAALAASRRRESINSSIGATSIRRLITLNNRNCRQRVAPHVRQKVCKNFTLLTLAHGLMCAILLPMIALQGSNSIWHHREQWLQVGPNIGSLLFSICFFISAGMCFITGRLIRKFGYTFIVGANYVSMSIFLLCHLYPTIYTLLPAYILLGVTLLPSWVSKIALIIHFGSKLSCSQHECTLSTAHAADSLDEHRLFCGRDKKVRRLVRLFQLAQDLGIIIGALLASIFLRCTASDWNCFELTVAKPAVIGNDTALNKLHAAAAAAAKSSSWWLSQQPAYFEEFYNHNEHGQRICGADMCPLWRQYYIDSFAATTTSSDIYANSNDTIFTEFINGKSRAGGILLIAFYFILACTALSLTIFMGKIQATFRHERIKDIVDTLLFAGPMAYFIGAEQAYMLGDFLRAFVSCSLGISMVAGAVVGMGIMQLIVSCTLSSLLRHTKRIVIIFTGFFFHSSLLLALSRWKPSSDDMAQFYVLAVAWGACNAIWNTLLSALITINHTNHVVEVTAPLQGLRFLGLGITFAAHGFVCETPKIIILVILLVVCVIPYTMLELRLESQRRAQMINL